MAQQQSDKISLSYIAPTLITLQSVVTAALTESYLGSGLPLHKLDSAQEPCLIRTLSVVF